MTNLKRYRRGTREFIDRLLSEPEAVAAVRALDVPVLQKVVDQLGLEDSGAILSLASTEQLEGLFDLDLWKNTRPGQEEKLDRKRLALWVEVLVEIGAESAAEQIVGMDFDFLTYALSELVYVLNLDRLTLQFSEVTGARQEEDAIEKALEAALSQEFDEYLVCAKDTSGWDSVVSLFIALDQAHHDFFVRLLGRLEYVTTDVIEENGGLLQLLTASEQAASDAAFDREQRREREGFVPPVSARHFLELAKTASLDSLLRETEPDPITRSHFSRLDRKVRDLSRQPPSPSTPNLAQRLLEFVGQTELVSEARPIESGKTSAKRSWLKEELQSLRRRGTARHEERVSELAYLANILIAGHSPKGEQRLRPIEASELVLEVVTAGLEKLEKFSGRSRADLVEKESFVKAFRIGWKSG